MSRVHGVSPKKAAVAKDKKSAGKGGRKARLTAAEKKKLRDVGIILLITAVLAVPYYMTLKNEVMWGMYIYYIVAAVMGAAAAALHFAAVHMREDPRGAVLEKARRWAIFVFMPLLLVILWDTTMLFLGDYVKRLAGL